MRHLFLTLGVLVLAAVCIAQPVPVPAQPRSTPPPATTRVMPAAATTPVPVTRESPLSKFEPLAAFPMTTQFAIRSVLYGSNWLARMNQPQGRFQYGYLPALRQPMEGDYDLNQAQAAWALAEAARFAGDDRQVVIASQAVLTLLAATRCEPNDPNCRVPIRSSRSCNRVGFTATLMLAIYALPATDNKLTAEADHLCEFLRRQLRTDGSIHYTDGLKDVPTEVEPEGELEYPGIALQALAVSNRVRPAVWKREALQKGLAHYFARFKAKPHPLFAATLTPAFAELHAQTQSSDAASAIFEMNDWLVELQYRATDPRHPTWAGGFKRWENNQASSEAPGSECGRYLQSLACAYHVNRLVPDREREARYRRAVNESVQFLVNLQYLEANTRHFADGYRTQKLIGGFYLSLTDGNLRIDATAHAVTGLIRYLCSGAER